MYDAFKCPLSGKNILVLLLQPTWLGGTPGREEDVQGRLLHYTKLLNHQHWQRHYRTLTMRGVRGGRSFDGMLGLGMLKQASMCKPCKLSPWVVRTESLASAWHLVTFCGQVKKTSREFKKCKQWKMDEHGSNLSTKNIKYLIFICFVFYAVILPSPWVSMSSHIAIPVVTS